MVDIDRETFVRRFTTLILQGKGFPQKQQDVHVLLKSATLRLQADQNYTEKEVNAELQVWVMQFGIDLNNLNYVTLRRYLVDHGYLSRDTSGSEYRLLMTDLPFSFSSEIDELDLLEELAQEKQARALRKAQFEKKS